MRLHLDGEMLSMGSVKGYVCGMCGLTMGSRTTEAAASQ